MSKKKHVKPIRNGKTSSETTAAGHEDKTAEKSIAKGVIEEPKAEERQAAEVIPETLPGIETPAAAREEAPAAEPVDEAGESASLEAAPPEERYISPRRSVAFIGSECYPFVKTGGLGDVMYALPKALVKQNCDVKVILPRYKCIPWEYQQKMIYRGSFHMDLCADGRAFYVGIMEYVWDGVVYEAVPIDKKVL